MNNKCKIIYLYFLNSCGKVSKVSKNKRKNKHKLFKDIKKVYPLFMHPYAMYAVPNQEQDNTICDAINILNKNSVTWFTKVKGFVKL